MIKNLHVNNHLTARYSADSKLARAHAASSWQTALRSRTLQTSIAAIFVTINVLYFLRHMPPIPLSLQDASVRQAITQNVERNYAVQSEKPDPFHYFRIKETFHAIPGARVFAYRAIFSPTSLNMKILRECQFYWRIPTFR